MRVLECGFSYKISQFDKKIRSKLLILNKGQDNLLGAWQFWAIGKLNLLGGGNQFTGWAVNLLLASLHFVPYTLNF